MKYKNSLCKIILKKGNHTIVDPARLNKQKTFQFKGTKSNQVPYCAQYMKDALTTTKLNVSPFLVNIERKGEEGHNVIHVQEAICNNQTNAKMM